MASVSKTQAKKDYYQDDNTITQCLFSSHEHPYYFLSLSFW